MVVNKTYRTKSVVLDKFIIKERDVIYKLFSEDLGRIDAIGYSAAKSFKRFGGRGEKFSVVEILVKKIKDHFFILKDIFLLESNEKIISSLRNTFSADIVTEIILKILPFGRKDDELFNWYIKYLKILDSYEKNTSLSFSLFEIAKIEGYIGSCERCNVCNKKVSYGYISYEQGIVCKECYNGYNGANMVNLHGLCLSSVYSQQLDREFIGLWEKIIDKELISKNIYKNVIVI